MLQHNFQGYEVRNDDESIPIIGFGISAISTISDGYAQNCINIEDYRQAILLKKAATSRGIIINYNDKLRREIIETLMCDMQVDIATICAEYGVALSLFSHEMIALQPLINKKLIIVENNIIYIRHKARQIVRLVCSVFDSFFEISQNTKAHAKML